MKKLCAYVLLEIVVIAQLCSCAHAPAKHFEPITTVPISKAIKSAHEQADFIYTNGIAPKAPEAMQLRLDLDTAQRAVVDLNSSTAAQFKVINGEVQAQTDRAVKAETLLAEVLDHLNRLRYTVVAAWFVSPILYALGPLVAVALGIGGAIEAIPVIGKFFNIVAGAALVLAGSIVLTLILLLAALFGWL